MATNCIVNCTIFRGAEKEVSENIAEKIFDNFIDAFAWLENFLDERYNDFEVSEIRRAGFLDETIELSRWDEDHNYWYTELYEVELV